MRLRRDKARPLIMGEEHIVKLAAAWGIDQMNLTGLAQAYPHAWFADVGE